MSKEKLCRLFGKTRHALYDHLWRQQDEAFKDDIILQLVTGIRKDQPRIGTRKLHHMLKPLLESHQIQIGRDYLFDLLQDYKLLIRQRRRKVRTTDSRGWFFQFPNLAKEMVITRPEQLWVSDITYIRMPNEWGYLSLITDACSRKIMGFSFRKDMSATGCLDALQMALTNRVYSDDALIHHSDRGSQYRSDAYRKMLTDNHISISMTENGSPYENALAERINGILKTEFNLHTSPLGFEATHRLIAQSIRTYNEIRPHGSCDYLTPAMAHIKGKVLKKRWKNYPYRKKVDTEKQLLNLVT